MGEDGAAGSGTVEVMQRKANWRRKKSGTFSAAEVQLEDSPRSKLAFIIID